MGFLITNLNTGGPYSYFFGYCRSGVIPCKKLTQVGFQIWKSGKNVLTIEAQNTKFDENQLTRCLMLASHLQWWSILTPFLDTIKKFWIIFEKIIVQNAVICYFLSDIYSILLRGPIQQNWRFSFGKFDSGSYLFIQWQEVKSWWWWCKRILFCLKLVIYLWVKLTV